MADIPVGGSWDEVSLPEIADPNAYALEISGDSMEPVYRDGDRSSSPPPAIRVPTAWSCEPRGRSHGQAARAAIGPADRTEKPQSGASRLQFRPAEITWMHRIIWASQ